MRYRHADRYNLGYRLLIDMGDGWYALRAPPICYVEGFAILLFSSRIDRIVHADHGVSSFLIFSGIILVMDLVSAGFFGSFLFANLL